MTEESFGQRLQRLRRRKGLSRVQLADAAGVSKALIGHYETGLVKSPAPDRAKRIAVVLGVKAETLMFGRQRSEPEGTAEKRTAAEAAAEPLDRRSEDATVPDPPNKLPDAIQSQPGVA